jgi:hypothetical protein
MPTCAALTPPQMKKYRLPAEAADAEARSRFISDCHWATTHTLISRDRERERDREIDIYRERKKERKRKREIEIRRYSDMDRYREKNPSQALARIGSGKV